MEIPNVDRALPRPCSKSVAEQGRYMLRKCCRQYQRVMRVYQSIVDQGHAGTDRVCGTSNSHAQVKSGH
jgi:hypothetical protein